MKMALLSGGEIIIDYLIKEGITHIFGVPGHGNLGLMDAIKHRQDKIKPILVRHEETAVFMADAFYRVSHRPAATFSSCGPGSINVLIGMAEAMANSIPLITITGNVSSDQMNSGALQETYYHQAADFPQVARNYAKRSFPITRLDRLPRLLANAFKTMITGRMGPVNIDVPYDLFVEKVDVEIPDPKEWTRSINSRTPGNNEAVKKGLELLLRVDKPLILAGGGVILSEAWDELKQLVETLKIPVYTSLMGKGSISEDHDLALGSAGSFGTYQANEAARSADAILALGCRFSDLHTSSWEKGYTYNIPPTKLIQVDIDPDEIGRNYPVEIGIMGDIKMVLKQMLEAAANLNKKDVTKWIKETQSWRKKWEQEISSDLLFDGVPIRVERLMNDLREVLPDNAIVPGGAGNAAAFVGLFWKTLLPKTHHQPGGMSSMGWGSSAVLGSKLADPDKVCVAVIGDGDFMMVPHVVATAVEYDIPTIWVIQNNYTLGAIEGLQNACMTGEVATEFKIHKTGQRYNPDFAAWAKACGAEGEQIEKPGEIKNALKRAIASNRPYVIDVLVEEKRGCPATGGWKMPPCPILRPSFGEVKVR
jgi:acetolactate synthase-1/2/3 large subunit